MTRKMLGDDQDARLLMSIDEFAGILDDLVRVGAEASPKAADCRIGRIEVEIDDRAEVEVEPEIGKLPRGRRIELIGFFETEAGNPCCARQAGEPFDPAQALNGPTL